MYGSEHFVSGCIFCPGVPSNFCVVHVHMTFFRAQTGFCTVRQSGPRLVATLYSIVYLHMNAKANVLTSCAVILDCRSIRDHSNTKLCVWTEFCMCALRGIAYCTEHTHTAREGTLAL